MTWLRWLVDLVMRRFTPFLRHKAKPVKFSPVMTIRIDSRGDRAEVLREIKKMVDAINRNARKPK